MKILLIGHSCSPVHGSEPGITWNWAWELAALHEVHLICHPEHRVAVEQFLTSHPRPSLKIHWVELPRGIDPWKPQGKRRWIRVHYLLWQHIALREALRLNREHRFDLVHQVGWMTVSVPPLAWKLGTPFIWGPIGGGQRVPPEFIRYTDGNRLNQVLRTLRIVALPFLPSLRRTIRHTSLVFVTNEDTERVLQRAGARTIEFLLDAGIPPASLPVEFPDRPVGQGLTVLWAGRLEPRKALPMAFDALARTGNRSIHLVVAGDGPMRKSWQALASRRGLEDRVEFLGRVPWPEMRSVFSSSDLFLFTSLNDTFGSVVAEAMSQGLPILTLAHQGVGYFVPDDAGIKVPVTTPVETVDALAEALQFFASHSEARKDMGRAAWSFSRTITWPKKAKHMSSRYEEVLRSGLRCTSRPASTDANLDYPQPEGCTN